MLKLFCTNMKKLRVPLRIVFYRDGQSWIAHCLEFDLLGDGDSREDAFSSLTQAIKMQAEASVELGNLENLFKPADPRLFLMFAAGSDVASGELHIDLDSISIDEAETREYVDAGLAVA